jgi:hypothetical protein
MAVETPQSGASACPLSEDVFASESGTAAVDLNGDGTTEVAGVFRDGKSPTPDQPRLVVYFEPDRTGTSVALPPAGDVFPVGVIGGYDVNGDGREELFVNTGAGAYTLWVDVYEFEPSACELVRLAAPGDSRPPQFAVGASVSNGLGLACDDGKLISTEFVRANDSPPYTADVLRTSYAIDGTSLQKLVASTERLPLEQASALATFECGGLELAR